MICAVTKRSALICAGIALLVLPANSETTSGLEELLRFEGRVIAEVRLDGNRVTREYVIRRELASTVGAPLRLSTIEADLQRLHNLYIFSSIHVEAAQSDDGVSLTIRVREIPYAVPYISYDVTDEDGWSFGPAVKSVNMMGHDVFVAGYALFGATTTYLLDLTAPWITGNHISFELDLSLIERDNELDGFGETAFEFSPRIGTYIGQAARASVVVSNLHIKSDRPGHTLSSTNRDRLVQLGVALGYDTRDSWGDPHRGWLNEIEVIKTGGALPGEADYWTTHTDIRRFRPIGDRTLVLAGLLSLQTGNVGSTLPEYMDYHLGGANSIRGYEVDGLGKSLKGRNQLLLTTEYRGLLLSPKQYVIFGLPGDLGLAWALFADSGIAWNDASEFGFGRLQTGIGAGIRLLMPAVDMARFDIAFAEDGNWRFHFAMYSKMEAQRFRRR